MLIKLKDNDGRVIQEVEVDDAFGEWYVEQEKDEENDNRRYRYWVKCSTGSLQYEGEWFADPSPSPAELYEIKEELAEENKRVAEFKKTLTPTQLRRLGMLENGMSERDIAEADNASKTSVHETIEQLRKKYREFFE